MANQRDELHVISRPSGHLLSSDCWCEPSRIHEEHLNGKKTLIVEHKDDSPFHHAVVISERNRTQDWITRFLHGIKYLPDRPLPKNPDKPE